MEHPVLEWVIVDGTPRHASAFAEIAPKRRPHAFCPQCEGRLTLKLGTVRRHHAAHAAGRICAATQPETALHINTKLALAAALSAAAGPDAIISILRECAGSRTDACEQTLVREWCRGWTDVLIEHRVGDTRRPDILLVRDGAPIGAVEILVSHAVSLDKARALAEHGVAWIEVPASEGLAMPGTWMPAKPLAVLHANDERDWRCDAHRAEHAATEAALDAARVAAHEAARHSTVLVAARVIDIYHAGGVRERFIYRVRELATDGEAHTVELQRGNLGLATVELSATTGLREAWSRLRLAFVADMERLEREERSFHDSPMRWAHGDAAENIVDEALATRTGYDPTPLATHFPRRWFYDSRRERWFLPPDMRDVGWDRAPNDPFAAHPAWARAQAVVRERPAPEGSWTSPVFANRPVAAMFRDRVRSVRRCSAASPVAIVDLLGSEAQARRALVVVERRASDSEIVDAQALLEAEGVVSVWISHPMDWTSALDGLAWAPAGRDSRGRGCMVIDGVGIFRADQFARGVSEGDRRLDPSEIRRSLAARVDGLRRAAVGAASH